MNKNNIEHMQYEWEKERELYTPEMWERFYEQKVDMVIGGINLKEHKTIHRPLMNITLEQAEEVARRVRLHAECKGYIVETMAYYDESEECHRVYVEYIREIDDTKPAFELRKLELVRKNKYLHNYIGTYVNSEGHEKKYEIISRKTDLNIKTFGKENRLKTDAVGMVILNHKMDKILLQKEWRMACNEWVYNIPGGLVDKGESIEQAAKREVKEETGLKLFEILNILPPAYTAVGISNESVATVIGIGVGKFKPSTSEDEQIEACWYTKEEVRELLKSKSAMSLRTQTLLYMWATGGKLWEH